MTSNDQLQPRSLSSEKRSYVRFYNRTNRNVEIYWLDFKGQRVKYSTLKPLHSVNINTFVTHPWIFRDEEFSDTLLAATPSKRLLDRQEVFLPPDDAFDRRRPIVILSPLLNLKEIVFQLLRKHKINENVLADLEVPTVIKEEYKKFLSKKS